MNAPAGQDLTVTQTLLQVAQWLLREGYEFVTVTPATHARVNARPGVAVAKDLRGIFGWSRPFEVSLLPRKIVGDLRGAGLIESRGELLRSKVRFSTLGGQIFAHSAYPTTEEDAVFFGPDTYRFVQLIRDELQREPLGQEGRILDVGCGAGPGGIMARLTCNGEAGLVLADINARALQFAAANAAQAGCDRADLRQGDLYGAVHGSFDLIVANPPYLNDSLQRTYRHGGGRWGEALGVRIVREGLDRLAPGGRLVLYTGAAIVDGADAVREALWPHAQRVGWEARYWEMDPDVFGEELEESGYAEVERIAAVALVVQRPR